MPTRSSSSRSLSGSPIWPAGTLLHRLRATTRDVLLDLGVTRHTGSGAVLLRHGDHGTHVVLLHNAVTKVTAPMSDGREALLAVRASGDLIGEMSALNATPRSATVTTCGEAMVSVIQRGQLRSFLATHPDAALELTGMVADRLRWANRRRVDFAAYSVKVRLARILCELARSYGQRTAHGIALGVTLTQPELATLCGAAEVSIQRALRELRAANLIATHYRGVLIYALPELRTIAELGPYDDD